MGLFDRVKSDNSRILSSDDMRELTLYNANGRTQTGQGQFTNPGVFYNPQGQIVASKKWTIAFHISDFLEITGTNETYQDWQGEFINSNGETVRGKFNGPLVSKTFNYVRVQLTEIKSSP